MKRSGCGRREFLLRTGAGAAAVALSGLTRAADAGGPRPPNIVVIFCDDMGYGDLACYGSTRHRTPHIDRLGAEGVRFTSFYVTSGVCTPSRSSLMTGCYPRRVTMHEGVLFPKASRGLHPNEVTMAEVLKGAGYATQCIGKWHLGDQREFLPTRQGFDGYFGIPYSNDMGNVQRGHPPLPLLRDETVIEAPVDQNTLTRRYTDEALRFITARRDRPFFLYLAHNMPHQPVHAGDAFRGRSANGTYGDAVEEIDASTGEILAKLAELGIDDRTLVFFSSDNGAAGLKGPGSNLPLSGAKGSTQEGGMRVPGLARWPGHVPAGRVCSQMAITLDLLPTFARLAGTEPPRDRLLDGRDMWPLLAGEPGATSPHEVFYFYRGADLQAVRSGVWKLHLPAPAAAGQPAPQPRLFDVDADVAETTDRAAEHPDVVARLLAAAQKAREDLGDGRRAGAGQRPAGLVVSPVPLLLPGTPEPPPRQTEFRLAAGASLAGEAAPQVAATPFSVEAVLDAQGRDGVIVAHGGIAVGYTLFVQEGKPAFALRRSRTDLTTVAAPDPLPAGTVTLTATVAADGAIALATNGRAAATGRAGGLLPSQPAEPLDVGQDQKMAIADYTAPNAFGGRIETVVIRLGAAPAP